MRRARFSHGGRFLGVMALAVLAILSGCRRQNDPRNISGQVTVESGDAGGVTVELFNAPSPESNTLWSTTAQKPTVGFPYSLAAIFEFRAERRQTSGHASTRVGDPVETDAEGKFEFQDVPEGEFVVVVSKAGFGWSKPLAVSTRSGAADMGLVTLYPEQTFAAGSAITGNQRWLAGHHYVVAANANLSLSAGATLVVEPGAFVRLGNLSEFRIRGSLDCRGTAADPIIFTSSDIENPSAAAGWQYIHFYSTASPPLFRFCSFTYTDQAILSDKGGGRIEYCYFAEISSEAVVLTGTGSAVDSVVAVGNVFDHVPVGLRTELVQGTGLSISHNVFWLSANYGLYLKRVHGGDVFCNWFGSCGRSDSLSTSQTGGVYLQDLQGTHLRRNDFQTNWYAIVLGSRVDSSMYIEYNRFSHSYRVLYVGVTPDATGPSFPHFNNNCAEQTENFSLYHTACLVNTQAIDARNNFWSSTSEADIRTRAIRDCDDDDDCPCDEFVPFLLTCPSSETGLCR